MAAKNTGLTPEEKAAVRQAAAERKRLAEGQAGEDQVLAAIAGMDAVDRKIAEGLHNLVKRVLPGVGCKTWYGFPAYGNDGKVVFFYQYAGKFKTRYGHIGFQDPAQLDDGDMWPTAFAVLDWTPEVEARVAELIKRAMG